MNRPLHLRGDQVNEWTKRVEEGGRTFIDSLTKNTHDNNSVSNKTDNAQQTLI
jgi:hypothetical protein